MDEASPIYPNLNDETQFRLNKINEIKDHFNVETWQRETVSKRLSKYFAASDFFWQNFVLSATSGGIYIASFTNIVGIPVIIANSSFSFAFSLAIEL